MIIKILRDITSLPVSCVLTFTDTSALVLDRHVIWQTVVMERVIAEHGPHIRSLITKIHLIPALKIARR